jgi:2-polyprenyl-6-hydroxyphenyl methylase/3-demethylubiquinone-9 3-methyltransferase
MPVDNDIYDRDARAWWNEDSHLAILKEAVNPARFEYLKTILDEKAAFDPAEARALDIGCGGGFFAEKLATRVDRVTGIDPSEPSIEAAQKHAAETGLDIDYQPARGEQIPFEDESFEIVCCCDVLEHVNDLEKVVEESARVLKPGGVFFYDTVNRTVLSQLMVIQVAQELPVTRFMLPGVHDWHKFIKPRELKKLLQSHDLDPHGITGIFPKSNPIKMFFEIRKLKRGEITYGELARKLDLQPSRNKQTMYMGYALKPS